MRQRLVMAVVIGGSTVLLGCGSTPGRGDASAGTTATSDPVGEVGATIACPTDGEEWEVAKVYIEHNATDADTGIHGLLGGAPWRTVCVTGPDGAPLWAVAPAGRLGELGVADFFWESNEPPNDEYPIEQLESDFPEGTYVVAGTGVDGIARIASATFTHTIPAAPEISHPPLVADPEEADPPVIESSGLVVRWEPVSETIDGAPVEITGYEVIVTEEDAEDPNGWARPVYDVHVDPDVTALPIPDEFVEPDTLYEFEVLAIEASGNQTISVGFARTG